ncbi:hypothetical protein ACFWOJ_00215 [Streptomyces sp. NPDC058439]|uniref:hypothetical protein n=1 Tax=Streptomyces sp. NPDC058439 TaxID=3346500 RepID=UPI0036602726
MSRAQRWDRTVWRPPQTMAGRWRGTGISLLMLAVGSGATALFSLRWGYAEWPESGAVAITAMAVPTGVKMTGGGKLSAVVTLLLCLAALLIGGAALTDRAQARRGEQTEALVSAVQPATSRSSRSCLLRRLDDGREIRHPLTPCDGYRKGDRVQALVDPLGRQAPVEGGRADLEPATEGAVALGALGALVLVMVATPLWTARRMRRAGRMSETFPFRPDISGI